MAPTRQVHQQRHGYPAGNLVVFYFLGVVALLHGAGAASLFPVEDSVSDDPDLAFVETIEYLDRYGYLSITPGKSKYEAIKAAVIDLQSFMEISVSEAGMVDKKTYEAVKTPRCGLKDPVRDMANGGVTAVEFTRFGPRWNKTELTYRIYKFPRDVKKSKFRDAVARACQLWSDVTPLTFREVSRKSPADIDIRFYSGFHNDDYPFDGPGHTVGHPVMQEQLPGEPYVAFIHVDADEMFTFADSEGINLFQVMTHQVGHALGLGHSSSHASVMSPCTKAYMPDFALTQTDIAGIQAIYGSREDSLATPATPSIPLLPSQIVQETEPRYLCEERPLHAVAVLAGEIYVFKGNRFWQFSRPNVMVTPASGSLITDRWPGLPDGVDAAYQRHNDNKAVFLKAGRMWIFSVHPKSRSRSTISYSQLHLRQLGLPRSVDDAFTCPTWPESTYILKKGKVFHFSDQAEAVIAGPMEVQDLWEGLPSKRFDAAFTYNGDSYFILGNNYWKVDHLNNRVEPGYPRSFHTDFLGC